MTARDLSGSMPKFKKDYRHIADRAEDCDLLADFHNLVRGSIYFVTYWILGEQNI
jgi:hypothetical protein